jgi:hypothetical protein
MKFECDISRVARLLFSMGLKLKKTEGNLYYFHVSNWAVLHYVCMVIDHGTYCVVQTDKILAQELKETKICNIVSS